MVISLLKNYSHFQKGKFCIILFINTLTLLDTAGQERFRSADIKICKAAHGIILVFSFTNRESFENLENWINLIKDNFYDDDIIIVLFGNKIDIELDYWEVTSDEAKEYAQKKIQYILKHLQKQ